MNQTFNLLFFLKKTKQKADGTVPIYARITIEGERKEISAKRYITLMTNRLQISF